eukprot:5053521-Prymnesium_polylepis.2
MSRTYVKRAVHAGRRLPTPGRDALDRRGQLTSLLNQHHLSLGRYAATFRDKAVSGADLAIVTDNDLASVGVSVVRLDSFLCVCASLGDRLALQPLLTSLCVNCCLRSFQQVHCHSPPPAVLAAARRLLGAGWCAVRCLRNERAIVAARSSRKHGAGSTAWRPQRKRSRWRYQHHSRDSGGHDAPSFSVAQLRTLRSRRHG